MWRCVLCSTRNYGRSIYDKEAALCRGCNSTWRARAVTLALITALGHNPMELNKISSDWSRVGLGISDDVYVSSRIQSTFFYSNTFYDSFPYLDIRQVPPIAKSRFEFVTCSDVMEHIDVDLEKAIKGISYLLRPGGFAVLSVPISPTSEHSEFYPAMSSFKIIGDKVEWVDSNGKGYTDETPEFHGGRGQNLAFRRFSDQSFRKAILSNGFKSIVGGTSETTLGVPPSTFPCVYVAWV
jgi:SAM-dependent methyltransferase